MTEMLLPSPPVCVIFQNCFARLFLSETIYHTISHRILSACFFFPQGNRDPTHLLGAYLITAHILIKKYIVYFFRIGIVLKCSAFSSCCRPEKNLYIQTFFLFLSILFLEKIKRNIKFVHKIRIRPIVSSPAEKKKKIFSCLYFLW